VRHPRNRIPIRAAFLGFYTPRVRSGRSHTATDFSSSRPPTESQGLARVPQRTVGAMGHDLGEALRRRRCVFRSRSSAAKARARPSGVRAPVEQPPWLRHLRLPSSGLRLHVCRRSWSWQRIGDRGFGRGGDRRGGSVRRTGGTTPPGRAGAPAVVRRWQDAVADGVPHRDRAGRLEDSLQAGRGRTLAAMSSRAKTQPRASLSAAATRRLPVAAMVRVSSASVMLPDVSRPSGEKA
jgi:hypothetical protein